MLKTIFENFSPEKQPVYCQYHERCVLGKAPTLATIEQQYKSQQEHASWLWLIPQIEDLASFCGAKEKMTETQFQQTAAIIATKYSWLKLTDIMLFCWRFKQGNYGKFYGTVDPMTITSALSTYTRERAVIIEKEEQKRRDEEYEQTKKNAIPCPDIIAKSILQTISRSKANNQQ